MADANKQELTFEQAMSRLETIVAEMEAGRLSLEESMARFEEGMALSHFCSKKLEATEKKIEVLVRKADAGLEWEELGRPRGAGDDDGGDETGK